MALPVYLLMGGMGFVAGKIYVDRSTLKAADWMTFAGAMLGAMITVAGAVLVVWWQTAATSRRNRAALIELVEDVLKWCERARKPDLDETDTSLAARVVGHVRMIESAIARAQSARQWFTPDSAGMVSAFAHIGQMQISSEAIRKKVRPEIMYGGAPRLDDDLEPVERNAFAALHDLNR